MFLNDHRCCICREAGKDVHLHHIDGNPSNNDPNNLAVLCLDCHGRVTRRPGMGRAYTPGEVRKYKRSWEQHVLASRRVHRATAKYRKELISQIDLLICEILAAKNDRKRAQELLDMLWELHLWRGGREIDAKILEGLKHLALMSGMGERVLAPLVAEKIWEMVFHFVGPQDVPMNAYDLRFVLDAIGALTTLAEFNCEVGHVRKAAETIAKQAENFFDVALWYNRREIGNAVVSLYEKGLKACFSEGGELEFAHGRTLLRRSLRRLRRTLSEERPEWNRQEHRINDLLDA
jgi:hypothetical protein